MGAARPEPGYVRQIRSLAEAAGVAMSGYRDHPLVLEAMTRAAIVVVPSRWNEPFGLTALEALACGAPLIVSSRGGLPEVVGEAAVYVDPESPEEIAATILALARDPARREALSVAGRERAWTFDTKVAAARLAELRSRSLGLTGGGTCPPVGVGRSPTVTSPLRPVRTNGQSEVTSPLRPRGRRGSG
jgi:UDP-glucose:(glucosyl)LPS alpha-1,2-glucosyltransferase